MSSRGIILGDCLEVLKTLEANSVDAVVTDPPYGLSFMNKKWDYDVPGIDLWREIIRVLKPGGHLLSFGGTRTYHRLASAIEDAGFEIRDQIQWLYGSGFPKSLNVGLAIDKQAGVLKARSKGFNTAGGKENFEAQDKTFRSDYGHVAEYQTDSAKRWQGWGTALKPANEPIVLARKPLEKGLTVAQNVEKWGVGGINIDACRIPSNSGKQDLWESEEHRSSLSVDTASDTAKQNRLETKESFVQGAVAKTAELPEFQGQGATGRTGTGCFVGRSQEDQNASRDEFLSSSIEQSGKNTSEKSRRAISSTTKTTTVSTIESKTLLSCKEESTPDTTFLNTPQSRNETQNTQGAHVSGVPQGRWPSNVLMCPEAAAMLDEQSGKLTSGKPGIKNKGNEGAAYGAESRAPGTQMSGFGDSGGASRFFYVAKTSKRERNAGVGEQTNGHPTVKPIKLMEYLCKLITPPGGIILDPFLGSGSTVCAAVKLGYQFIGIERESEYVEIAKKRIEHYIDNHSQ